MGKCSIVIPLSAPLGFGSRQDDIELRYCLRSIERHLSGYGDIFIVGHMPKWVQGCIHIPATDDPKTWNKEKNIFNKIMLACQDERISEDFLFMNDDQYLLQKYEAGSFPFYCFGLLSDHVAREDQYGNTAKNTAQHIEVSDFYFDVHCPIVYNKSVFRSLQQFDWEKKYGYCIKTMYMQEYWKAGNRVRAIEHADIKINEPISSNKIRMMISDHCWFSIGNKAFEGGIMGVLQELYSKPSRYER
jgi:hypothetical protein